MPQEERRVIGDEVLVALGGNEGDARQTVLDAMGELAARVGEISVSALYQTPAFPAGAGPEFINAACLYGSEKSPSDLLAMLHDIEAEFGRERVARWGQRTLDLDLIACGDQVLPDATRLRAWIDMPLSAQQTKAPDQLLLPHPRVQDRPFVLVPLADVAPDWVHPVLGRTVVEMLAAHSDDARAEIQRIA